MGSVVAQAMYNLTYYIFPYLGLRTRRIITCGSLASLGLGVAIGCKSRGLVDRLVSGSLAAICALSGFSKT